MPSQCAIWARVSTDDQDTTNQLAELLGMGLLPILAEHTRRFPPVAATLP